LYDNVPWNTWTIDPDGRNRDAAGNPIIARYHLGKRDVYDRFMRKDWYGRSLSVGNILARVVYILSGEEDKKEGQGNAEDGEEVIKILVATFNETAAAVLAKRVLDLELKDVKMAVAETEEQCGGPPKK